ncbi:MAG: hypothetical protein SPI61_07670 [Ezakiella sp.]|uniref:hypothetical protein n=1 Tax=Ezakiella sp. TaxID=1935205 RepID=UPI002970BEC4|nr:hypothetical protein [Ezakiella sp.]MDD7731993.1 hypothetical protein [Eubacteriales bacterium]MDY6080586.1 hypothetical protein [Ezakiella sp.]
MRDSNLDLTQFGYMRKGFTRCLRALKDSTETIEIAESNGSRRYKLLKAIIDMCLDDPNYVVDKGNIKPFKYKFKDGELIFSEILDD